MISSSVCIIEPPSAASDTGALLQCQCACCSRQPDPAVDHSASGQVKQGSGQVRSGQAVFSLWLVSAGRGRHMRFLLELACSQAEKVPASCESRSGWERLAEQGKPHDPGSFQHCHNRPLEQPVFLSLLASQIECEALLEVELRIACRSPIPGSVGSASEDPAGAWRGAVQCHSSSAASSRLKLCQL